MLVNEINIELLTPGIITEDAGTFYVARNWPTGSPNIEIPNLEDGVAFVFANDPYTPYIALRSENVKYPGINELVSTKRLDRPIASDALQGSKCYTLNLVAAQGPAIAVGVTALRLDRNALTAFVSTQGQPQGGEYIAAHAVGDILDDPFEDWTEVAQLHGIDDLEFFGNVITSKAAPFVTGSRIRIGSPGGGMGDDEHLVVAGGTSATISGTIKPPLLGLVSSLVNIYNPNRTVIESGVTTTDDGLVGMHFHSYSHRHNMESYQNQIPVKDLASWAGSLDLADLKVTIRGVVYKILSYSGGILTVHGAISGPVFEDDEIRLMSLLENTPVYATRWQHYAVVNIPPVMAGGHSIVRMTVGASIASNQPPLASVSFWLARPTPRASVFEIVDDKTVIMRDRNLLPGNYELATFNIKNKWNTQTTTTDYNDETPRPSFVQPADLGYHFGV